MDEESKINQNKTEIDSNFNNSIELTSKLNKFNYFNYYIQIIFQTIQNFIKTHKNIFIFICNLISFLFYALSLKGCTKGEEIGCVTKAKKLYIYLSICLSISCIINTIIVIQIIYKKINPFHLLYIIFGFYLLYNYDSGTTLRYHGGFNMQIFIALSIFLFFVFNLIIFIYNDIKKKKYIKTIIIFFSLIFIYFIPYIIFQNQINCKTLNWDLGLNNTRIINHPSDACKFKIPKKCYMNFLYKKLDFTKMFGPHDYNSRENFVKKLNIKKFENVNYFGYPSTIINGNYPKNYFSSTFAFNYVHNNMINMETYNKTGNETFFPEITVKFNEKGIGKLSIQIKRNETLSKERKKKENPNSLYKNILMIMLDAVSRNRFQYTMLKTQKFLQKFMKNQNNNFSSFEFLKYQAIDGYTAPNIKVIYYGENIYTQKGENIVKYFKDNGYITGHAINHCGNELFYDEKQEITAETIIHPWDYENVGMYCGENYQNIIRNPLNRGPSSWYRRIMYGRDVSEYNLEYTRKFWETYIDNRKVFRLNFLEGHEDTAEVLKYLDQPLSNFLENFYKDGLFNDTILIFFSDHGLHLPRIFHILANEQFIFEKYLAFLYIVINNNDKIDYKELLSNQQKMITPYDYHATLMHIIYGKEYKNESYYNHLGISLFEYINETKRSCDNYLEFNKHHFMCRCY